MDLSPLQSERRLPSCWEVPNLVFDAEDAVRLAAENRRGDFVDRLIHFIGDAVGCERTVTFNRNFARLSGVELLKSRD